MTDDLIKNIYDKHIKKWVKNNYKFLLIILIYMLYQENFLLGIISSFGIKLTTIIKPLRLVILALNDLIYVGLVLLMFKKEIAKGFKDFKRNFQKRVFLATNCWMIGCLVMTISTILIDIITGKSVSTNESLVRQSISLAPLYMLFACSIVAPILEEMTFRRALHGLIKNKWLFIIISGMSFGLLHVIGSYNSPLDFLYVIPYGSMGCAFAYLLVKTENITLPITVHMLHNFILVLIQILVR